MASAKSFGWTLYGGTIVALSWLHYGVLSRFGRGDGNRSAWFSQRRQPVLPPAAAGRRIWIHAVSAGEAKIAQLLRQRLLENDPDLSVVLSSTTASGFARVKGIAGEQSSFVMPLDTLDAQRRVVRTIRPDLLVLVESEYWPAQFEAATEAQVPVAIVNATMSERSFARHSRYPAIARRTLLRARRIFAQDDKIAGLYEALGVPRDRLAVTGNLKLVPAAQTQPRGAQVVPRIVFGSVHRDELPTLGPAVRQLRDRLPDTQLVLVPRYPGRIPVEVLQDSFGAPAKVVTDLDAIESADRLVWVDRMGILAEAYQRADIGVVCGTFADIGGHDLVEPLHAGAVSVYGPDISRQRPLHQALQAMGSAVQAADAAELVATLERLMADPPLRSEMVSRLRGTVAAAAQGLGEVAAELARMAQPRS